MEFRVSNHAKEEMVRRSISEQHLITVMNTPQQIVSTRGDLKAYQSIVDFGNGKMFLIRVIVNDNVEPAVVVTVYRTSKIAKYWRIS